MQLETRALRQAIYIPDNRKGSCFVLRSSSKIFCTSTIVTPELNLFISNSMGNNFSKYYARNKVQKIFFL